MLEEKRNSAIYQIPKHIIVSPEKVHKKISHNIKKLVFRLYVNLHSLETALVVMLH